MKKILLTSVAIFCATAADAATITVSRPDSYGRQYVDIRGPIVQGDDKLFESRIGSNPDPNRVIVRLPVSREVLLHLRLKVLVARALPDSWL
jgi:hypothetical protein